MGYSGGRSLRKSVPDDLAESGTFLFCAGKMLVLVPAWAVLVTALVLGQAREAPGQGRGRGWAERPARQRLVQVLLA
jgi:hypothetical protein